MPRHSRGFAVRQAKNSSASESLPEQMWLRVAACLLWVTGNRHELLLMQPSARLSTRLSIEQRTSLAIRYRETQEHHQAVSSPRSRRSRRSSQCFCRRK
jgi:hypothetical protein